jgi:phosphoserine phosphatase RsbU/P
VSSQCGAARYDDKVVIEVHNVGEPIAPELLPEIFLPLRRGQMDNEQKTGSIGLGLFVVERIVHAHGGSVSVTSNVADGTTFRVRLPRRASPSTVLSSPQ